MLDDAKTVLDGETMHLSRAADGIATLVIETPGPMNTLSAAVHADLARAVAAIEQDDAIIGLLITSARDDFVVGADIGEFAELFAMDEAAIAARCRDMNDGFRALEDLRVPSVAAMPGMSLGGGLELAMCCDARVLSKTGRVGLPEVTLGVFPGLGGTVRAPRLAGCAPAIEMIVSGNPLTADKALAAGFVTETAASDEIIVQAEALLRSLFYSGDWQAMRARKVAPVENIDPSVFDAARKALRSGPHQPAASMAIDLIETSAQKQRSEAQEAECLAFAQVARTQAAASMTGMFFAQRAVNKAAKAAASGADAPDTAGVLGAGIMGGGIAYTLARNGVEVRMRDIAEKALDAADEEVDRLVAGEVKRGKLDDAKGADLKGRIAASTELAPVGEAKIVIEAVVERLDIKRSVITDLEQEVGADTVIASNTSSLRIDDIAAEMDRPERLVGMHFFNPVPRMPLVEIVRGLRSSDSAVARAVATALKMCKTPVVVADCPGFLVNRILVAYINAFTHLVSEGVDFRRIDRVMEEMGWPMGPALLQDVVGMDTGAHVIETISAGYPDRMIRDWNDAVVAMSDAGRLGQKSGSGFYAWSRDDSGRLCKEDDPEVDALIASIRQGGAPEVTDGEIEERMMLALVLEAIHALEDNAVGTPAELDMALIMGIGLPTHMGGALAWADWVGLPHIVEMSDRYKDKGPAYRATEELRQRARNGISYRGARS
ncbi:3-hydroxyacyl-CoA dehydrogenase NAD-binding domain-containing protein [Roseivivax marinus]|uniref:3-hydroxyacyl-CoA dehydrogenase NAD-binding domain-containing protein n=1 Tax=Roseivivax marinus TaxID=1379903 RepID=UPI001F041742|nr:3-hydroxyacyl-CoA dehydrogenase NAD-binding domain-containing protein [Roseivivax marinus]UMA66225.1 3-hydroxyacyl-CoA dehydrogenase NAD-binding domain-containing protein [Roseivivax marinus]